MTINVEIISFEQSEIIRMLEEGQFGDVKSIHIAPARLTKIVSAFSNSDGGDLYIGISEEGQRKVRKWEGFRNQEAANGHLQAFEQFFPLGPNFQYEFLKCPACPGLVLHVLINKTKNIYKDSKGIAYIRRGAQCLPQDTPELFKRLEFSKGSVSFESEKLTFSKEEITQSNAIKNFIEVVIPTTTPESFLRKQQLLREDNPTVAGAVLFSDEPQALIPKHCGVKIYRYATNAEEGFREALSFTPKTVEGCLYQQIIETVKLTIEIIESIPVMGETALERISYPKIALHEVITNAIIHRDYNVADDIHIKIFDNRIEVQSPGRLPAHITTDNILDERFARNGAIVRILNKYPDPPNKDVGEGLNTAFAEMHKLGLKEPKIFEKDNNVVVLIKHERLASPEEAIMDYLEKNATIRNKEARTITHITADWTIKNIFGKMVENGLIEQVPGTDRSTTAYRKKTTPNTPVQETLLF